MLEHHRQGRPERSGVTLIEAVLASVIIGISFVAFFGLAGQSMASVSDARNATTCAFLAESQMNRLLGVEWDRGTDPATAVGGTNYWSQIHDPGSSGEMMDPSDQYTGSEADGSGNLYAMYALEHPRTAAETYGTFAPNAQVGKKDAVDAGMVTTTPATEVNGFGPSQYYVTWDVKENPWGSQFGNAGTGTQNLWVRLRVRCTYRDYRNTTWRGFTLQTYKVADAK